MNRIRIVADSSCDLITLDEVSFVSVPLTIRTETQEFRDDASLWTEALTESLRLDHSSYDLFYLVLARREGATLFTLDRKLQKLCDKNGVNAIWLDCDFG